MRLSDLIPPLPRALPCYALHEFAVHYIDWKGRPSTAYIVAADEAGALDALDGEFGGLVHDARVVGREDIIPT